LNRYSLYTYQQHEFFEGVSFQHQTYKTIKENHVYFNLHLDHLKIISVVRNPYHRIISDMLFVKMIDVNSVPDEICNKLANEYLANIFHPEIWSKRFSLCFQIQSFTSSSIKIEEEK
jgi:hypothetical protein